MAGKSMCVGTRQLTDKQSKSTSACSIYFHCPDLQGSKRKHSAQTACREATEGTGGAIMSQNCLLDPFAQPGPSGGGDSN